MAEECPDTASATTEAPSPTAQQRAGRSGGHLLCVTCDFGERCSEPRRRRIPYRFSRITTGHPRPELTSGLQGGHRHRTRADDFSRAVFALAQKHGLTCFDLQRNEVHNPSTS
jgi:hypothetical protein